jgi:hypothetical protein
MTVFRPNDDHKKQTTGLGILHSTVAPLDQSITRSTQVVFFFFDLDQETDIDIFQYFH